MRPRARRVAVLGWVPGAGGRPLPLRGSGVSLPQKNFFEVFDAKSRVWGQFGPENKLIEGQPDEYDVICRNASVLAFHLLPTIFAGAPSRLQNICRNGRGVASGVRGCGPHRAAPATGGKRAKIVFKNSRENSDCNFVYVFACNKNKAYSCSAYLSSVSWLL